MSKNPVSHHPKLYEYIKSVSLRETKEQKLLRQLTQNLTASAMQISPDQGQFMAMLVKLIGAKQIIEIGTFTGYSALSMALALPEDGRLIACDVSREWAGMGKPFWQQAGVDEIIDLQIGPAIETLEQLINQGLESHFDMVFIDADKTNYVHYYEGALRLVRPNGLIVVDNVFWNGAVVDEKDNSDDTTSIRNLNQVISNDLRVDISMIAVGDGLFLVRKR
ncbi:class I SAM-dependent methyltransferase [Candidatus Spongiihabitans sp.]|uniref:class I SAM-dependent methyltransferase n=1 Tax=Candidatus Spongiihabitans sp. TaxID=3101308 RepID=UPI003C6F2608